METEYPYLYPYTHGEAARLGEQELWDTSFRENVCCARAIEKSIRYSAGQEDHISEGCAWNVLDDYGFRRTQYVLAYSVKELGPVVKASPEVAEWAGSIPTNRDSEFGRYYTVDTALLNLEEFIGQVQEEYQNIHLFGKEQCDADAWKESLEGKVLVLSPDSLREDCWNPHNQLWLCTGGFGAEPNARGRAVYATCLGDGEETRWNREDFAGVLKEGLLPEWAQEKLEELHIREQERRSHAMDCIQ